MLRMNGFVGMLDLPWPRESDGGPPHLPDGGTYFENRNYQHFGLRIIRFGTRKGQKDPLEPNECGVENRYRR